MKSVITILLLGLTIAASTSVAQVSAYKYELNKPYSYIYETKETIVQDMRGRKISASTESNMAFSITVTERMEDGSMNAKLDIKNAMKFIEGPDGMHTYGNDLNGKSYTFSMDAVGDITDIDTTIRELNGQSITLVTSMAGFLPYLPADKMKDGESWERVVKDTTKNKNNDIKTKVEIEYEIDGSEDVNGISSLIIKSEGETEVEGETSNGSQDYIIMEDGEMNGTFYYSAEQGIITKIIRSVKKEQVISMPTDPSFQMSATTTESSTLEYVQE